MTVFSQHIVAEIVQTFWAALRRGEFIAAATLAQVAGVSIAA